MDPWGPVPRPYVAAGHALVGHPAAVHPAAPAGVAGAAHRRPGPDVAEERRAQPLACAACHAGRSGARRSAPAAPVAMAVRHPHRPVLRVPASSSPGEGWPSTHPWRPSASWSPWSGLWAGSSTRTVSTRSSTRATITCAWRLDGRPGSRAPYPCGRPPAGPEPLAVLRPYRPVLRLLRAHPQPDHDRGRRTDGHHRRPSAGSSTPSVSTARWKPPTIRGTHHPRPREGLPQGPRAHLLHRRRGRHPADAGAVVPDHAAQVEQLRHRSADRDQHAHHLDLPGDPLRPEPHRVSSPTSPSR